MTRPLRKSSHSQAEACSTSTSLRRASGHASEVSSALASPAFELNFLVGSSQMRTRPSQQVRVAKLREAIEHLNPPKEVTDVLKLLGNDQLAAVVLKQLLSRPSGPLN